MECLRRPESGPRLVFATLAMVFSLTCSAIPSQADAWDTAREKLTRPWQERAEAVRAAGYRFDEDLLKVWRESLDPSAGTTAPLVNLADAGFTSEAFHLWVLGKLDALRLKDFGRFGWHDYHQHPARSSIADLLAGHTTPEEYYSGTPSGMHFLDIFEMVPALQGEPAAGRIEWLRDRRDPHIWSQWADLPETDRMNKTDYRNFEIFTSLAGRYWKTGDPAYRRALLRLQADFHRHHFDEFWRFYYAKTATDADVQAVCQADWRSNTNALMEGWRLQNTLRQLAALAKSAGPDKPARWDDVLSKVAAPLPADAFDAEETANIGWTILGAARQYPEKLFWFVRSGAIPNQKIEALGALTQLNELVPEHRNVSAFRGFLAGETDRFVSENFLPDGGMLEQSLNYNYNTRENLARLAALGNPSADFITRENNGFDAVLDGIRSPLGTLPQIGNNKLGDAGPEADSAPTSASGSKAYPYSGYYALRSGGSTDDTWLFFKNSRQQRGHLTRDNNSIQFTAFGRPLLVCGGPPDYGLNSDTKVHAAREYFSEDSSLKANTVLVDGKSQAARGKALEAAPLTPMSSVWLDTPQVTVVDGIYDEGYGGASLPQASPRNPKVAHHRTVYFFKESGAALVVDRMNPADDTPHRYTQVWKFPPALDTDKARLKGFREEQVSHDEASATIRTTDPAGANVTLMHDGPARPQYAKFHGNTDPVLGWYAPGLSTAVPAVDYHAAWEAAGPSLLLTWIVPSAAGESSMVERIAQATEREDLRSSIKLTDGTVVSYATADVPGDFFETGTSSTEAVELTGPESATLVVSNPGRSGGSPGTVRLLARNNGPWEVTAEGRPITAPAIAVAATGDTLHASIDPAAAGAKKFSVASGEYLQTVPPGEPVVLRGGEGVAAWLNGGDAHPSHAVNMAGARPVPSPMVRLPAGAEPGWQRHVRPFTKQTRLYDAALLTLADPAPPERVQDLVSPAAPDTVAVYEGWIEATEAGSHRFQLKGHRQAALNFRGPDGQLLPPLLTSENKGASHADVDLEKGFYPVVITAGGFHRTIPEVSLEVTRLGTSEPSPATSLSVTSCTP